MGFRMLNRSKMLRGMAYLMVIFYLFSTVPFSAVAAGATTEITHEPLEYYNSGKRIAVEAEVSDRKGINLVRLYFKSDIQAEYLFVPMDAVSRGTYEGILPVPNTTAKYITYLFLVVNDNNVVVRSQEFIMHLNDDKKTPAWQQAAAEDQITLYSEIPEVMDAPMGFTDSIAMDAVESGVRFGIVAGTIYSLLDKGGAAAGSAAAEGATAASEGATAVSGTAAAATSGGTIVAGAGGMSALGITALVAGVVAAGGGAALALSDEDDEEDHHDDSSGGGNGGGSDGNGGGVDDEDLQGQSGEVRINLQWSDCNDLDLHVTDPCGNEIYFSNRSAVCQGDTGTLDVDANAGGCSASPAENIVWTGDAPSGSYTVEVDYYSGSDSSSYTVVVINGNDRNEYSGAISSGSRTITTFSH